MGGAAVLDFGEHDSQTLGALPAVAGSATEYVALAAADDVDRDVNGSVGNLPGADLQVDGIDERHRIHRLRRPVAPFPNLGDNLCR